jgi:hypothetical protein
MEIVCNRRATPKNSIAKLRQRDIKLEGKRKTNKEEKERRTQTHTERDKGSYQVVNRLLPFLFQDSKLEEKEAIQFAEFGAQVGAVEEKPDERSGSALVQHCSGELATAVLQRAPCPYTHMGCPSWMKMTSANVKQFLSKPSIHQLSSTYIQTSTYVDVRG